MGAVMHAGTCRECGAIDEELIDERNLCGWCSYRHGYDAATHLIEMAESLEAGDGDGDGDEE